jgi:quercetin dioxygenase-like cupin family protein
MEKWSLTALADGLLSHASSASSHLSSCTVHGGPPRMWRQTVIAMVAGQKLAECDRPGEAIVQVLRGRVRIAAGDDTTDGSAGQLLIVPDAGRTQCRSKP